MSTTTPVSDEWIGKTVKGVAGLRGIALKRIALRLGIEPSALSNKVHGRSTWAATEVSIVADELGVEVAQLLNGFDGLVPPPGHTTGQHRPFRHITDFRVTRIAA